MRSYIYRVELTEDPDGRWNAVVPALQACYTWGRTQAEALENIHDAVRCCVEDMLAHGEAIPEDLQTLDSAVASVVI